MSNPKEPMTANDAMKIIYLLTTIAAIPVGIWSYKSSEDWIEAIARFVAVEMVVFLALLLLIGFFMGLAGLNDNPETK